MHSWICGSRERKKLKVNAKEGQCNNVTEVFMARSYGIDGDYMFGVTVGPIARLLETLEVCLFMFIQIEKTVKNIVCVCGRAGGGAR